VLARVQIRGFRGFRELQLESLGRVNLFVGANNAGETSILEALEILVVGAARALWRSPLRRGEEILATEEEALRSAPELDPSHLFAGHSLDIGATFSVSGQGKLRRTVECTVVEGGAGAHLVEDAGQTRLPVIDFLTPLLAISFKSSDVSTPTIFQLSPERGIPVEVRRALNVPPPEDAPPVLFLQTEQIEPFRLRQLWDGVVLTPEEDKVVQALRIIEPHIERIAFLSEGRRVGRSTIFLKMSDSDWRLPLGSVGDGLKRLLALSLNLIRARRGFLFVDEIDTGLHFSVMTDMWKLVIDTASRLDVQVFATTHSLDCVRALAWVRERISLPERDVTLQRVEKGRQRTISYTMDEIVTAAKNHIEVR
jgi:hypothetical protein